MGILIHGSSRRAAYLYSYLIPKLCGTDKIKIDMDAENKGNLQAYLDSYRRLPNKGDTWHLEDDVLPDRRFKEWMEQMESFRGIVCGFGCKGSRNVLGEIKDPEDMWYSFPCIRIPNDYIKDFLEWLEVTRDEEIARKIRAGKGIDFIFHKYVCERPIPIYHHNPCMVEHVDDLIGGSLISVRREPVKAVRFEDKAAVEELKHWTARRKIW